MPLRIFYQRFNIIKQDQEVVGSLKHQLAKLFEQSLRVTVPEVLDADPAIAPCQNRRFGDYQWYF